MLEEIRTAKLAKLEAETRRDMLEGDYAALKIAELKREQDIIGNNPGEDNIFSFAGPINDKTVYQAITTLSTFSRRTPGCDITIFLTSPGGSGMAGFALYDYIGQLKAKGHKVTIHVIGYAMSMAVTLLQCASERVISPNSFLLIHEASFDPGEGSTSEHEDHIRRTKMVQERVFRALAQRSNLKIEHIRRKARKNEWMLDAEEALKYGLVDRISEEG